MTKHFALILIVCAGICALTACGSSDDDGEAQAGTFKAYVVDFGGDTPIPDVKIWALDNDTGEKLEGVEPQVSDAEGWVTFTGIPEGTELLGFLCEGKAATDTESGSVDTYQYNLKADAQDEKLWLVDSVTYETAPLAAGLVLDKTKGVVAGAIYWVNAEEEEEIVGCSTVTTDPATEDIRYFNDNRLPVNITKRSNVNPLNGYYLAANMDVGEVDLIGYVGSQQIGTTRIFSVANSICISNIYAETDANPMPADCE